MKAHSKEWNPSAYLHRLFYPLLRSDRFVRLARPRDIAPPRRAHTCDAESGLHLHLALPPTNSATQATWALSRAAVYVPLRHIAPLGGSRTVTTLGLDEEPAIRGRGEAQVHGEEPVCNKDGRVRGIRDTGRIEEIHVVPVTGSAANPYIQDEISGLVKHRNITGLSDSFSQDHAY
ncbi:hypothetical protein AcW1_001559 [Taiwanofungus camphoratus]|nr:hypothetical protein AcW1_001559 [Antrodia cinnamomea]